MPPSGEVLPPAFEISNERDRTQLDYFYLKLAESNPERHSQWWIKYRRAQLWTEENPELSCDKFSELAKDPLFPINFLAWVRAHEVCGRDSEVLKQLGEVDIEKLEPWVKPVAIEVLLVRAERDSDKERILKYSYEKSKFLLPMEEKVRLTQRALEMAQDLDDKKQIQLLTKRLHSLAPRLDPRPHPDEWLKVAKDYRRAREFDQARSYYHKVLKRKKSTLSQKLAALHGIRYAWKNEREKEKYLEATEDYARFIYRLYKRNKRSAYFRKKVHDAYVELMRTYWTLGQIKNASSCLDFLERELRKKYSLAEVYWLRGRMQEERQNYSEAVKWFTAGLNEKAIDAELTEKLYWYQAWNLRKIKDYAKAREAFEALKDKTDSDFAKARYQFWLARTLEDLEAREESETEYRKLIENDPLGYYGLLAHRQIHELIPADSAALSRIPAEQDVSVPTMNTPQAGSEFADLLKVPVLEWLISVEEYDLARNYLDETSKKYSRRKEQSEETWLKIFNSYARSGHFLSLYEQLGQLTPERRTKILSNHPELLFPRPYYQEVQLAADRFQVSKELIYSIMRQESAFNPRARSHADAFGLMQMLPEVAQQTAQTLDIEYARAEDLFDPYTNIQLGSAFVKDLWEKYSGQFILAVASYNASETAIRGWMLTRFTGDSVEFIEDIPYEETRGYVRLVMRNFIFYQVMEAAGKRIPFPDWVLQLNPIHAENRKSEDPGV